MKDKEILKELSVITKDKVHWNTAIDDVAAKLGEQYSADVKAKALWLLGEMGLQYPLSVQPYIEGLFSAAKIAQLKNTASLLIANIADSLHFFTDVAKVQNHQSSTFDKVCG